jgi:hypothetical protein
MAMDPVESVRVLLVATEEAHGIFEATELHGVYDQEWAAWYAEHAVEGGIGRLLGHDVTATELAGFLARSFAEFERLEPRPSEGWTAWTARRIVEEL